MPSVSTHSRPKAAGELTTAAHNNRLVSTHSRPKAAGLNLFLAISGISGFNTQPPEGGWKHVANSLAKIGKVSTHSRPKAAGTNT